MIHFTIRHMIRHWRLILALLAGLTLVTGLLAGLPSYAESIAAQTLAAELEAETPAGRNAEIRGSPEVLTGALFAQVDQVLGDLLALRIEKHSYQLEAAADPVAPVDGGPRLEVHLINVWAFDHLRDATRLVEGDYPSYDPPRTQEEIRQAMFQIPVLEASISTQVAEETGIQIGDVVYGGDYRFRIVGLVDPMDAESDVWWGDLTPFELVINPGVNEDTRMLPVIIHLQ